MTYDAADRRTSLTMPNGIVVQYSYDAASQLTGQVYKQGGTTIGDLTFTLDVLGRRGLGWAAATPEPGYQRHSRAPATTRPTSSASGPGDRSRTTRTATCWATAPRRTPGKARGQLASIATLWQHDGQLPLRRAGTAAGRDHRQRGDRVPVRRREHRPGALGQHADGEPAARGRHG